MVAEDRPPKRINEHINAGDKGSARQFVLDRASNANQYKLLGLDETIVSFPKM